MAGRVLDIGPHEELRVVSRQLLVERPAAPIGQDDHRMRAAAGSGYVRRGLERRGTAACEARHDDRWAVLERFSEDDGRIISDPLIGHIFVRNADLGMCIFRNQAEDTDTEKDPTAGGTRRQQSASSMVLHMISHTPGFHAECFMVSTSKRKTYARDKSVSETHKMLAVVYLLTKMNLI